jgi:MOSC domain-containing protein YiiM
MKLLSLNVGEPRTYVYKNAAVTTGIFKQAVTGPRLLRRHNLEGDGQADLVNHGGVNKAVYAYPSEHYELWRHEIPDLRLEVGIFGENFTTSGLHEASARIGDHFRIGRALVRVTQPRIPCYKLALRTGREDIIKRFLDSGRSGIYFAVVEEGLVECGDSIERIFENSEALTVAEINLAYTDPERYPDLVQRAADTQDLPPGIRNHFQKLAVAQF